MGENTEISWADDTFNPWMGCTKVSPACDGCYAEALMDTRYGKVKWGPHGERVRTSAGNWAKPLKWEREQAEAVAHYEVMRSMPDFGSAEPPSPRFVFCASLADVFDNAVPAEWRRDLFDLIRATPHLTWLLLTKRPGNIVKLFGEAHLDPPDGGSGYEWPLNALAGTSIEDTKRLHLNAVALSQAKLVLDIPTIFWSCEPLLEDLGDIRPWLYGPLAVGWVITGGETDQGSHKARPSHPDWFRDLRDQCADAGVPYHHKQNGEWAPGECSQRPQTRTQQTADWINDGWSFGSVTPATAAQMHCDDEPTVWRLGKTDAGRWLDGQTHNARPEVA